MSIKALEIEGLRCLERTVWSPGPGLNAITGINGAGKTSLLEAIALACTGKALRSGGARAAIAKGQDRLAVRMAVGEGLEAGAVRYERSPTDRIWAWDGTPIRSAAVVYERVPLMVFSPETHYAVVQDASARRAAMYWLMFHVEHQFLEVWRRYQRLLRQRNTALRARDRNYRAFDPGLVQISAVLAGMWERALESLQAPFAALIAQQGLGVAADIRIRPGWPGGSLEAALEACRETDERLGYTQVGPHRADIGFRVGGRPIQEVASHGQQKVVVSAWRLALVVRAVEAGRRPVLLLDDLGAELDRRRRAAFYETLGGLGLQAFVTALEPEPLPSPAFMFHVEQGRLHGP